jgi:prepilin peptidase CpaA
MTHATQHCFLIATLAACAVAAVVDLRTGHIPDWLTLGLLGIAPFARAAAVFFHQRSWHSALEAMCLSVLSAAGAAVIPALLSRSGGLGGGDVKLFAAIGASSGFLAGLYAQTYAYVFAMVQAMFLVARRNKIRQTLENVRGLFLARVGGRASRPASPATGGSDSSAPRPSAHRDAARHAGFTEVKFAPAIFAGLVVAAWAQWKS